MVTMRTDYAVEDTDGFTTLPLGIGISLPFLLYVTDKQPFHVKIKGQAATLVFWKRTRDEGYYKNNLAFPLDQVDLASNKGVLHYSDARVYFTDDFVDPDRPLFSPASCQPNKLKSFYENVVLTDEQIKHYKSEGDDFRIVKVALRVLNQFISHYRFETLYYFTPNVRLEDFVVVRIYAMRYKPTFKTPPSQPYIGMYDVTLTHWKIFPFTGTRGHLPLISDEQRDRILSRANFGEDVPIASELIISANNHFQEGNYRQAIIDVQTAFEVKTKNQVEKHMVSEGVPRERIENTVECGIVNLLKEHYPKCPDAKPFSTDSKEYKKWEWAYKVRIAMTHSGSNVPEQDALVAFGYYHATFRYLFDMDSWIQLPELPINLVGGGNSKSSP